MAVVRYNHTLQNLPKNVGDLDKLIIAKGFKKMPKVRKMARSGHTDEVKHFLVKSINNFKIGFDRKRTGFVIYDVMNLLL